MRKHIALLISVTIIFTGCIEEPDDLNAGQTVANIYPSPSISYFAGITDSIRIDIGIYENPGFNVSQITLTKQFINVAGDSSVKVHYTIDVSTSADTISFIQSISELFEDVPINDIILTESDLAPGDHWLYRYSFSLSDGTLLSKPNSSTTIVTFLCPSNLAGTHDISTVPWCGGATQTGTSVWVREASGVYSIEGDWYDFRAYFGCYGDDPTSPGGNLRINDLCNELFWTGESRWGENYTFNAITVTGPTMVLDWENDYGESGITTITREGGADWPPLFTNN